MAYGASCSKLIIQNFILKQVVNYVHNPFSYLFISLNYANWYGHATARKRC